MEHNLIRGMFKKTKAAERLGFFEAAQHGFHRGRNERGSEAYSLSVR
jgi:hypothetical protein